MLLSRAKENVERGLAIIVSGRVRFLDPTGAGYNAAPGYARFSGAQSFDPEMGGGPTVVQYFRPKSRRPRA